MEIERLWNLMRIDSMWWFEGILIHKDSTKLLWCVTAKKNIDILLARTCQEHLIWFNNEQ